MRLLGVLAAITALGVAGWLTARARRRSEIDRTCAVVSDALLHGRPGTFVDGDRAAVADLIGAARRRMQHGGPRTA